MQKYVILTLLEPMKQDTEFEASDWPLHITLASNFVLLGSLNVLQEKLTALVSNREAIKVSAGHDEYFGDDKRTLVTLINMNEKLISLHYDIIALLKNEGAKFDEPQYLEKGFRAHATIQKNLRLQTGDEIIINQLSVIDMFPGGDISRRKLLYTFVFS